MVTAMGNRAYSQQIAEEIRVLLTRRSLTRQWLALQIGIHESTLSSRLNGRSSLHAYEIAAIAEALNVNVTDLMPPLEEGAA